MICIVGKIVLDINFFVGGGGILLEYGIRLFIKKIVSRSDVRLFLMAILCHFASVLSTVQKQY